MTRLRGDLRSVTFGSLPDHGRRGTRPESFSYTGPKACFCAGAVSGVVEETVEEEGYD